MGWLWAPLAFLAVGLVFAVGFGACALLIGRRVEVLEAENRELRREGSR